ncbi:hypothetical protein ABZ863_12370 [Saccharomonospora sp. NPDC046836]|uniref:hypothetical protein n=1 Tax=Saccharomonospora sp. NPDC046836 TaxID=3156921 RepID=UPI0033E2D14E
MAETAFSAALRQAISASGLGLDRIQVRLQERGIIVSVTALSYWQSGKRRPERPRSMSAVRTLEEILGLPTGSLLGLLPPLRKGTQPLTVDTPAMTLLSLRDRCDVDPGGTQSMVTATTVLRADTSGQDRWLLTCQQNGGRPPVLRAERNCTLGRVEVDHARGLTLAELLFGRTLDDGGTQLVEYSLRYEHPRHRRARKSHFREFFHPVSEYLLEVRFGQTALPERCWRYARPAHGGLTESSELRLDDDNGVQALALDFGPGVFGIAWTG